MSYFDNNVTGALHLLSAMEKSGVRKLVFSSSATVYGEPQFLPLTEEHPLSPINPYGRSKLMVEDILRDQTRASSNWSIAILRYFNPVGAYEAAGLVKIRRHFQRTWFPFLLGWRSNAKVR